MATKGTNSTFLFLVWSKARYLETQIREDLAREFTIIYEKEIAWPRKEFTWRLRDFYGFGSSFMWWNKGRKCGRGPFMAFVIRDDNPTYGRQYDTRGRYLLVNEHVCHVKKRLRALTHHSNIIHSSVTADETYVQLQALGLERFCNPRSVHLSTVEELDHQLAHNALTCLGAGSRRACYAIPNTGYCLKCYRTDTTSPTVSREIQRSRLDEKRNTSCQEYRYYRWLRNILPPSVFAVFPDDMTQVLLSSQGWCLIESRITNADQSACMRFSQFYRQADPALREHLLAAFWLLITSFAAYSVRFYDPQNILVQKTAEGFKLRIVDFEPASRTLIPLDRLFPSLIRLKVIRRAKRYLLEHLQIKSKYKGLSPELRIFWDDRINGVNSIAGLSDCRLFLQNKVMNDAFYVGKYKERPCIVKCSSRCSTSIVNEYQFNKRVFEVAPRVVAEPFLLDDHLAVVITERILGSTLTDLFKKGITEEQADSFAQDIRTLAQALQRTGILHRDLFSDNLLLGQDGHLKAIDWQLAIDRNDYHEDPWLIRNWKYHYVVFGVNHEMGLGVWNDFYALCKVLRHFPQTPFVKEVIQELRAHAEEMTFRSPPQGITRFNIRLYGLSLYLQMLLKRKGTRKFAQVQNRWLTACEKRTDSIL